MLRDLILKNRSCRRFVGNEEIPVGTLRELVDLARLSPSAANLQPLKYLLSHTPETNALIFPHLRWAAYLKEWHGPREGERPSAYIVIFGDTEISHSIGPDHGIATQSILLGAVELGYAGCIIASMDTRGLTSALKTPPHLQPLFVLALGRPAEEVRLEPLPPSGDIRYWRDAGGVHHVPKRSLDEIIIPAFHN
jgi:nitroreductase